MTKTNARKTITKERVLVPSFVRSPCWKKSSKFIVVVLVRKIGFLFDIIFFRILLTIIIAKTNFNVW